MSLACAPMYRIAVPINYDAFGTAGAQIEYNKGAAPSGWGFCTRLIPVIVVVVVVIVIVCSAAPTPPMPASPSSGEPRRARPPNALAAAATHRPTR